jgi:hypothetical protein
MKKLKIFASFIFFIGAVSFAPMAADAEETNAFPKEPVRQKSLTMRETEILGTVEKPQFSTELPWKSPLIDHFNAPQLHRSFKKEIFRPVHPLSELKK